MIRALTVLLSLGVAFPLVAQAPQGKKYALLVGVNDYDYSQFRPLRWAVNDAVELGELLKTQGYEVEMLYSGAKLAPTGANIKERLAAVLDKCKRHDTVLIAFAGHGVQMERETANDEDDAFFCPQDARIAAGQRGTLISLRRLYRQLDDSGAGVKLLVVDACRDIAKLPRGVKRSLDGGITILPPRGVAALFSCSAGEAAFEVAELKHGIFFHVFLEGLRGKAAMDERVTWDALQLYVRTLVPHEVAKRVGDSETRQNPTLSCTDLSGPPAVLALVPKLNPVPPKEEKPRVELPKYIEITLAAGVTMKLVRIEPGKFLMGSPSTEEGRQPSELQHEVEISQPFYMGIHEVTRGQFRAFASAEAYRTDAERNPRGGFGRDRDANKQDPKYNWQFVGFQQTDDHPVVNVSWHDARAFCAWLSRKEAKSFDLPTEAEWEFACRAGTTTRYSCGEPESSMDGFANVLDQYHQRATAPITPAGGAKVFRFDDRHTFTAPVGTYQANHWGLYDMHGNVGEWCKDWFVADYYRDGPRVDPPGPGSGTLRAVRGGNWRSDSFACRAAYRGSGLPDAVGHITGFRVVVRLSPGGKQTFAAGGSSVQVPKDFPKDVPIYPGARPFEVAAVKKGLSVTFRTPEPFEKVWGFYTDKLAKDGWVREAQLQTDEGGTISSKKDNRTCLAIISKTQQGASILLSVLD